MDESPYSVLFLHSVLPRRPYSALEPFSREDAENQQTLAFLGPLISTPMKLTAPKREAVAFLVRGSTGNAPLVHGERMKNSVLMCSFKATQLLTHQDKRLASKRTGVVAYSDSKSGV